MAENIEKFIDREVKLGIITKKSDGLNKLSNQVKNIVRNHL